jgi:hypothetical protein
MVVRSMKHDTSFGVLTGNGIETLFFKAGDVIFREGDNALELFVDQKRAGADSDRQQDGH